MPYASPPQPPVVMTRKEMGRGTFLHAFHQEIASLPCWDRTSTLKPQQAGSSLAQHCRNVCKHKRLRTGAKVKPLSDIRWHPYRPRVPPCCGGLRIEGVWNEMALACIVYQHTYTCENSFLPLSPGLHQQTISSKSNSGESDPSVKVLYTMVSDDTLEEG